MTDKTIDHDSLRVGRTEFVRGMGGEVGQAPGSCEGERDSVQFTTADGKEERVYSNKGSTGMSTYQDSNRPRT